MALKDFMMAIAIIASSIAAQTMTQEIGISEEDEIQDIAGRFSTRGGTTKTQPSIMKMGRKLLTCDAHGCTGSEDRSCGPLCHCHPYKVMGEVTRDVWFCVQDTYPLPIAANNDNIESRGSTSKTGGYNVYTSDGTQTQARTNDDYVYESDGTDTDSEDENDYSSDGAYSAIIVKDNKKYHVSHTIKALTKSEDEKFTDKGLQTESSGGYSSDQTESSGYLPNETESSNGYSSDHTESSKYSSNKTETSGYSSNENSNEDSSYESENSLS